MADPVYVLDASAVLAAFFDEPGADVVADHMSGALMSAVNLSEVVAKLIDRGASPDQIAEIVAQLDIDIVPQDETQAMAAGLLRRETRSSGLSLGDRSCLALAIDRKAVALTGDRAWLSLAEPLGVEVLAIR
ncbi:twitching motility protein PilT [Sphingomonas sp. Leaf24]|uniref:type II toxin-antitoxin system VapC family toxin n=1 Tax=unclassified Sphingomonas TaxID=196159 RepID=UPI0006F28FDE|nr:MULTISPECIES: type II toxin-antitoxin system VapC family toxin [unclassified Sphingomonas]KQM21196.1 twitching motility protein PilT [Sphingomonas sp. Leaf5]KQM89744.1 twitching motility protein PilT [Sphingomonas sp. Leaf24]